MTAHLKPLLQVKEPYEYKTALLRLSEKKTTLARLIVVQPKFVLSNRLVISKQNDDTAFKTFTKGYRTV